MDPNAALAALRELIRDWNGTDDNDLAGMASIAESFVENFSGLDSWIMSGGFLPRDWTNAYHTFGKVRS